MIRVEVWKNPGGHLSGFRIQGHAGYADSGEDIVCAGATAVAETAILGLKQVAGQPCAVQRRSGFLECMLKPGHEEAAQRARIILETMILGLKDIEKDYGKYICVTEGG